jgi:hypothetical protein
MGCCISARALSHEPYKQLSEHWYCHCSQATIAKKKQQQFIWKSYESTQEIFEYRRFFQRSVTATNLPSRLNTNPVGRWGSRTSLWAAACCGGSHVRGVKPQSGVSGVVGWGFKLVSPTTSRPLRSPGPYIPYIHHEGWNASFAKDHGGRVRGTCWTDGAQPLLWSEIEDRTVRTRTSDHQ